MAAWIYLDARNVAFEHSNLRNVLALSLTDASHNNTILSGGHDSLAFKVIAGSDDTRPSLNLKRGPGPFSTPRERPSHTFFPPAPIVFIIPTAPRKGVRGKMAQAVPNNRPSHRGLPSLLSTC